jgi:ankyrin repeat protein
MSKKIILLLCVLLISVTTDKVLSMEKRKGSSLQAIKKAYKKRKIDTETLEQPSIPSASLSGLPDELKLQIIRDYLITSPHWQEAKSVYDIDKLIKRRALTQVNKNFRDLILDPTIKLELIKDFVKQNPQQAINDLIKAVAQENVEMVKNLIKAGTGVNMPGSIIFRSKDYSKFMAPEELKNYPKKFTDTHTPLKVALSGLDSTYPVYFGVNTGPNINIIRALLAAGANPNLIAEPLATPPLISILENDKIDDETKEKIILMLLRANVNPNSTDPHANQTALEIAIEDDYHDIVKALLDYGANPFPSGPSYPVGKAVPNITPAFLQADEIVKQMILNHSYDKLLFQALKDNNYLTLERLINSSSFLPLPNFDINARDENGYTALMVAIHKNLPSVRFLLSNKADPNITANDGTTALNIAREKGDFETISLLKEYGAKE